MDRHALPVCTLAVLWLPAAAWSQEPPATSDLAAPDLAPHAIAVRSIDPRDRDFADLEPLIDKIGAARIVVLGEATHSEGSTSAAKARLAIFLHQHMGFDVLAWEAGVLDCAAMNRALRDPSVDLRDAAQQMMRGGWDASELAWPLFEYARNSWQSPRPLRMAGFDGERPPHGARHFRESIASLEAVGAIALDAAQRRQLAGFAQRAFGYLRSDDVPIDDATRAAQLAAVRDLEAALDTDAARRRASSVERGRLRASIRQGYASEERKQGAAGGNVERRHPRDPSMARAFHWLATNEFAERRIMIWAATAHLTRNTTSLKPIDRDWDYTQAEHMGDTVYRDFGDQLYTIAVTSHHGTLGNIRASATQNRAQTQAIEPPLTGSFEDLAHQLEQPYLFVDLRGAHSGSWLQGEFVARPLGFIPTRATWADVIDAFVFIDEMEPERLR
ncbi:MAG: erythromycin esterase family protein [Planctomycetota bacterium]